LKDLVAAFARGLVSRPDEVDVREDVEDGVRIIELSVAEEDRGRVIGRRGRTARAFRTMVDAVAERRGERCRLEILG
jgi:predicted RNA-binding protein YlqC (UPF0109 family)